MGLNKIDVPRRAVAACDYKLALLLHHYRMVFSIFHAGTTVRRSPVARINADSAPALVHNRVNQKRRLDQLRYALALFMHSIAVQKTSANAFAPTALFKIKREHVSGFNCLSGSKARTDALAPARETREVMKAYRADENDVIVFFERAVDFNGRAAFRHAKLNHA